jgi:hypothetical protein
VERKPTGPQDIEFREDFAHGPQRWLAFLLGEEDAPRFAIENPQGPEIAVSWRGRSDPKAIATLVQMLAASLKVAGFPTATLEVYGRDVRKDFSVPEPGDRALAEAMPPDAQVCSASFAGEAGKVRFWIAAGREDRDMSHGGETAGVFVPLATLDDGPRARQVWNAVAAATLATWPGTFDGRLGPWLRAIRDRMDPEASPPAP